MSIEIKKAVLLGVLSAGAFGFAGSAQADCSTDTAGQWECLQVGGVDVTGSGEQGPFTFSGATVLDYDGIVTINDLNCTLSLDGYVDVDTAAGRTYIRVSGGEITGSGQCNDLVLQGFNWNALESGTSTQGIPDADDVYPAASGSTAGDIATVQVGYDLGFITPTICSGTISNVQFANGTTSVSDPSTFTFDGSFGDCSVNGVLSSQGTDVNAW